MSDVASARFEIINELGLHARAAATLVRLTGRLDCAIAIAKDGQRVNGKSILGMMTLAAAKGSVIDVRCEGPGAAEALDAIGALIADRFGEDR